MSICGDYDWVQGVLAPQVRLPGAAIGLEQIGALLDKKLGSPYWRDLSERVAGLAQVAGSAQAAGSEQGPEISGSGRAAARTSRRIENGAVVIDAPGADSSIVAAAENLFEELIPWRKGPFKVLGLEIDAEWRSDLKWNRIEQALIERSGSAALAGYFAGKRILDIGCNNGYYLFRSLPYGPAAAIGIDPVERCLLQYALIAALYGPSPTAVLPIGVDELDLLGAEFDLVLCLGVTYHRRDPAAAIRKIKQALAPGGVVVIESLVIPGDGVEALKPGERYAKMRNVHLIPTAALLADWLKTAGFADINIHSTVRTTSEEQRTTEFSPGESLAQFLDPSNPELTIEGYPAPRRTIITAAAG